MNGKFSRFFEQQIAFLYALYTSFLFFLLHFTTRQFTSLHFTSLHLVSEYHRDLLTFIFSLFLSKKVFSPACHSKFKTTLCHRFVTFCHHLLRFDLSLPYIWVPSDTAKKEYLADIMNCIKKFGIHQFQPSNPNLCLTSPV